MIQEENQQTTNGVETRSMDAPVTNMAARAQRAHVSGAASAG